MVAFPFLHPLVLPFLVTMLMYVRRRGGAARLWWRVLVVNGLTSGMGLCLAVLWVGEESAPSRAEWVLAWVAAWMASVALKAWGLRTLDRHRQGHPDVLEVAMANLASYVPLAFFVQTRL
ncbi:MAG TPA: hypothetical protein VFV75_19505 [Candidatus Polarisedimenticolaceae bacterium]|nr:hypothetical protein [Candidatus Polarisedimenticolaceae bacterium]